MVAAKKKGGVATALSRMVADRLIRR